MDKRDTPAEPEKVQRYGFHGTNEPTPDPDGTWVKYQDVAGLLDEVYHLRYVLEVERLQPQKPKM